MKQKSRSEINLISLVIPIHNEQDNIEELYERLVKALQSDFADFSYEIIFVDDGSLDRSYELLKELHQLDSKVKVIKLSRNFGHHVAITAGLDAAKGDYVVMMDGDLQDQPEEIVKLYKKLQEGCDVVFGERVGKKFSFLRRIFSKIFLAFIKKLVDQNIEINTTIFRIMRASVVSEFKRLRESSRYIVGIIGWVGFRHGSTPVVHGERKRGVTKYGFGKQLQLALNAIFAFSDYPLKLISRLGFFCVMLSFIFGFYVLLKKLIYGVPVLGWASLIVSIFFIGGLQIFILGILGEYIGRIYMEAKGRPLYIVQSFLGKDKEDINGKLHKELLGGSSTQLR